MLFVVETYVYAQSNTGSGAQEKRRKKTFKRMTA